MTQGRADNPEIDHPLRGLIVRVGAMGDVLHALPAVAALRQAVPEAYLGWLIEPRWLPLLSSIAPEAASFRSRSLSMPLVDHCFLARTALWRQHGFSARTVLDLRRLARDLRTARFPTCVDMQGSLRSASLGRLSGAARLVGGATPRERPAKYLYTERVPTPARHVIVQACELLSGAFGLRLTPAPVSLPLHSQAYQWAETQFAGQERLVLLAPTAGWGAKEWPADRFAAVARALVQGGCRVLVNATSAGDDVAHRVITGSAGTAELVACSLTQLIALVRRSSLVIAGDTGPLHLAAALAVPVVGLYGPTDPARTGPWGNRSRVLRDAASITDHRRHRATEAGLLNIEVSQVIDAAWELLSDE